MEKSKFQKMISNKEIQDSILFAILGVALSVYSLKNHYGGITIEWKMSPYLFPILIAIFLIALSVSLFFDGCNAIKEHTDENTEKSEAPHAWKGAAIIVGIAVIYYFLMGIISFIPATILFLVSLFWYFGERRKWLIGLLSVSTTLIIYLIFGVLLHVMLP